MIYLDHNATAPLSDEARQAWLEAAATFVGNPSSPHRLGSRAEAAVQGAREKLARLLGCAALDIVWTSGATESNNTVLHHFARALPGDQEIWVSAIEHPCVMRAAGHYFPRRHRLIPVRNDGRADLDWLAAELTSGRPGLVALMAVNNETGILQPWREALRLCQQAGVPFLCDAVQWLGRLPAAGLGECDFLTGSAHKFGGPKGVGFIKCPAQGRFHPLLQGGPQEEGRRAGTENVPAVLALMAGLEGCEKRIGAGDHRRRAAWREQFERRFLEALPGSRWVGGHVERLWNTVSVILPPTARPIRWVVKLDKAGFAVSTGSACASGREKPSHVLAAMGLSPDQSSRVLRFSSGWATPEQDWHDLTRALEEIFRASRAGPAREPPNE